jgi:hypothetical protein
VPPNTSMEPTRPARCRFPRDTSLGWPGGSSRGRYTPSKLRRKRRRLCLPPEKALPAGRERTLLPNPPSDRRPPATAFVAEAQGSGRLTTRWSRPGLPGPVASGRRLTLALLPAYPLPEAGPGPRARGLGSWFLPRLPCPRRPGGSSRGRWAALRSEHSWR